MKKTIIVSGANSSIGKYLIPALLKNSFNVYAISRNKHHHQRLLQWVNIDISNHVHKLPKAEFFIHLAPLPLLPNMMKALSASGVKSLVAFGSTSIFTKKDSTLEKDCEFVRIQQEMEQWLPTIYNQYGISWTLFRPTMIYGCGIDQNITFIQQFIQRFGFFPVAGRAKGLRQPVHAADLAEACLAVLGQEKSMNWAYNLSGGEILSYHDMVKRIFRSMNRHPKIVHLPVFLYKCVIHLLKRVSEKYAFIQTSMVDRMNMDMVFDHADATHDFGYDPRPFQP